MTGLHMSGAGNDFVVIDTRGQDHDLAALAIKACESTGADGFLALDSSPIADFRLHFYNSDGLRGEMCGNGARCICRYAYENGLVGEEMTIQTDAGLVHGLRLPDGTYRVRLNNPSVLEENYLGKAAYVELGNPGIPHAVVPVVNLKAYDEAALFSLGRALRYHPAFPKGANVNFYEIIGEDHLYERTYERGVEDFTYACGTGTGSVVTVLTLKGQVSGHCVAVDMAGGRLTIDVERDGETITDLYLTGPTNIVCKGEITDEEL